MIPRVPRGTSAARCADGDPRAAGCARGIEHPVDAAAILVSPSRCRTRPAAASRALGPMRVRAARAASARTTARRICALRGGSGRRHAASNRSAAAARPSPALSRRSVPVQPGGDQIANRKIPAIARIFILQLGADVGDARFRLDDIDLAAADVGTRAARGRWVSATHRRQAA